MMAVVELMLAGFGVCTDVDADVMIAYLLVLVRKQTQSLAQLSTGYQRQMSRMFVT